MPKKTYYTRFGNIIKDEMDAMGYTIGDISNIMKCSVRTIQRHLTGERTPNYLWCMAYGNILKLDPEFLWRLLEED